MFLQVNCKNKTFLRLATACVFLWRKNTSCACIIFGLYCTCGKRCLSQIRSFFTFPKTSLFELLANINHHSLSQMTQTTYIVYVHVHSKDNFLNYCSCYTEDMIFMFEWLRDFPTISEHFLKIWEIFNCPEGQTDLSVSGHFLNISKHFPKIKPKLIGEEDPKMFRLYTNK